ncbi:uncharacterized protein LOC123316082 isoform X2 [Coccinella septempunctata]|uniref:uncharacterized protein LOC123316082 isoform X2 n=1 Tax=Coccinella septempunctata TaxID=41139 RepID=UPI001D065D0F|nr:uncharacterized protein LOC123316082 isoform X2 [Coccinella septempunctata]
MFALISDFLYRIYYTVNTVHSSFVLNTELNIIFYNSSAQPPDSFLNPDTTSTTSIVFTFLILVITACGIVTSFLLLYGLYKDCKMLLLPWVVNLVVFMILDILYIFYNLIEHALKWNPFISILIMLDFFITCLHIYALLCVISQYQELKAGRGRALDDQNYRIPNIQYSNQPTATSYLSTSRRPMTTCDARPTPTQSPTGTAPPISFLAEDTSPSSNLKTRKSVKFPDHSNHQNSARNGSQLLEPWTIELKPPLTPKVSGSGSDTAPLIESATTDSSGQPNL